MHIDAHSMQIDANSMQIDAHSMQIEAAGMWSGRAWANSLSLLAKTFPRIELVLLNEVGFFGAPYHPFACVLVVPFFSRKRPAAVRPVTRRLGIQIEFGEHMPSTQWTS
jgi:hypothetical protein